MELQEVIQHEVDRQEGGGEQKTGRAPGLGMAKEERRKTTYRRGSAPEENPKVGKHTGKGMDVGDGRNVAGHVRHTYLQEEACRHDNHENRQGGCQGHQEVPWGYRLPRHTPHFMQRCPGKLTEGRDTRVLC